MKDVQYQATVPIAPPAVVPTGKESGPDVEAGVFLIDKPVGPTSFQIVRQVRKALGIKKVGHAGTLDPFASGLLILCAGRPATRIIDQLMGGDKTYEATLRLGIETDTQDLEGEVVAEQPVRELSRAEVEACLAGFVGEGVQTPPRYSALKHKGKPLYYYARKGIEVVKPPRPIIIRELLLLALGADWLTIRVHCGKGTYVRTLGADIGNALGCGAHLIALRRLQSGPFSVTKALPGDRLADREQAQELLARHRLTVDEALAALGEAKAG
ncbi:MAG: tRNA pseudouridine(55) synthase TruB [Desulfobulbaceae bacterium]|nr:tRNA pseudouridine(55) synthase TruB [Desulfobulbaceae bacterium]